MDNTKFQKLLKEYKETITEGVSSKDIDAYLKSALWSSPGDNSENLDDDHDIGDVDKSVINQAKKDLNKFYKLAKDLIENGDYDGDWRHDFWLTRNGHGAGFWDDSGEDGDKLTKIVEKNFKGIDLYVGDDGKIYS